MKIKDLKKILGKEATKHGPWLTNGYVAVHEDEIVGGKDLSPEQMQDLFGMRVSAVETPSGEKFSSFLEQPGIEWRKTSWLLGCYIGTKKAQEYAYTRIFIPAAPTGGARCLRINEQYVRDLDIQTLVSKGEQSPCVVTGKKVLVMPAIGALGPKDAADFEVLRSLLDRGQEATE